MTTNELIASQEGEIDRLRAANAELGLALGVLETAARRYVDQFDKRPEYVRKMCEKARAALARAQGN